MEVAMKTKTRDRIVVESEKVGRPAREGDLLEVTETPYGTTYRVAWDDGHESEFRPSAGSARVIRAKDWKDSARTPRHEPPRRAAPAANRKQTMAGARAGAGHPHSHRSAPGGAWSGWISRPGTAG
jgi:hypothetical protein